MAAEKPSNLFWKNGENSVDDCKDRAKGGRQREREGGAGRTKKQHTRSKPGRPSLKELCPDDKRRVRQLIEELARVSSEKETAEERLRGERKAFQEILLQLRSEHREVLKEKQDLESELHTSQLNLQSVYMYPHTEPTHYQGQPVNSHPPFGTGHPITGHSSLTQPHSTSQRDNSFPEGSHYTPQVQPSRVNAESQGQRVVRVESILAMPARDMPSSASHNPLEAAPSAAVHAPTRYSVPAMHTYTDHDGTSTKYPESHANAVTLLPSQFAPGYTSMTLNEDIASDCLPTYRPESTTPVLTWTSLPAATPPTTPPREESVWCTGEGPTTTTVHHTSNVTTLPSWLDTGEPTYSIATQTSPPPLSSSPALQTSVTVGVETGPGYSQMHDAQVQVCIGAQSISYSPPTSPQCSNSQSVQHRSLWASPSLHTQSGEKEVTVAPDAALPPHPSAAAECLKPQGCLRNELLPAKPKFTPRASITDTFASTELYTESLLATALLNAQHTVQSSHTGASASRSWRHGGKGELQAARYGHSGCDSENTDDRPLSPAELAVSLNQSTSTCSSGELSRVAHSYPSHRNLKAQFQCCAETEELLDDDQVINDLFFI